MVQGELHSLRFREAQANIDLQAEKVEVAKLNGVILQLQVSLFVLMRKGGVD